MPRALQSPFKLAEANIVTLRKPINTRVADFRALVWMGDAACCRRYQYQSIHSLINGVLFKLHVSHLLVDVILTCVHIDTFCFSFSCSSSSSSWSAVCNTTEREANW